MIKFWAWLATRAATGWVAVLLLIPLAALVIYVQQLRVEAARCEGRSDAQELVNDLTDRVVEQIQDDTDAHARAVRRALDDGCLDRTVPDSVRGETDDH